MSNARPKLNKLARRLLAHEASLRKPSDARNSTAFHVCDKLRQQLGKLLGVAGFRVLLARAQQLGGREVTWLLQLEIQPDGSIEKLDVVEEKLKPGLVAEGEVVLVAQLMELLVIFIGAKLTQRIFNEVWPDMKDLTF